MRPTTRLLPIAAFLISAAWMTASGQSTTSAAVPEDHRTMVTRLYTGADGLSHFDETPLALHGAGAEESAPQLMSDAYVVRGAPGFFETWHNADKKRYIVVVSGEAEVVTTGGEKATFVPGHIYLAEDLTGKGHTFRVVGNQEWVALFVNFAQ